MKRPAVIVLVIILACSAVAIGLFVAGNSSAPKEQKLETELKKAQDELAALKSRADKLLTEQKNPQHVAASTSAPAPSAAPARTMTPEDSARAVARKQLGVGIDLSTERLFQRFALNDKEHDNLKQLMVDRQMKVNEFQMRMMDPSLTPTQRAAVASAHEADMKASDGSVRQFLNSDDDFKAYQRWADTYPEILQLRLGAAAFQEAGAPLSDDQREQLIDLMAATRAAKLDPNDPRNVTPSSLTSQNITAQIAQMKADNDQVATTAARFLSPEQVEALKKMQQQTLALSEAGMHMMGAAAGK